MPKKPKGPLSKIVGGNGERMRLNPTTMAVRTLAMRFHRIGASARSTRLAWESVLLLMALTDKEPNEADRVRYL